jgi:hypothetical protein
MGDYLGLEGMRECITPWQAPAALEKVGVGIWMVAKT